MNKNSYWYVLFGILIGMLIFSMSMGKGDIEGATVVMNSETINTIKDVIFYGRPILISVFVLFTVISIVMRMISMDIRQIEHLKKSWIYSLICLILIVGVSFIIEASLPLLEA